MNMNAKAGDKHPITIKGDVIGDVIESATCRIVKIEKRVVFEGMLEKKGESWTGGGTIFELPVPDEPGDYEIVFDVDMGGVLSLSHNTLTVIGEEMG